MRRFIERRRQNRARAAFPVYAVQGATQRMNRPIATSASHPDKTARGKAVRGGFALWNVGTEHCKDFLLDRLAADGEHGPEGRVIRFPEGLPDTYYDGLLAEYRDPEKRRYVKRKGARWKRNEPLDTLVYAWAIGHHREVNIGRHRNGHTDPRWFDRLAEVLERDGDDQSSTQQDPATPAGAVVRGRRSRYYVSR